MLRRMCVFDSLHNKYQTSPVSDEDVLLFLTLDVWHHEDTLSNSSSESGEVSNTRRKRGY